MYDEYILVHFVPLAVSVLPFGNHCIRRCILIPVRVWFLVAIVVILRINCINLEVPIHIDSRFQTDIDVQNLHDDLKSRIRRSLPLAHRIAVEPNATLSRKSTRQVWCCSIRTNICMLQVRVIELIYSTVRSKLITNAKYPQFNRVQNSGILELWIVV